MCVNPSQKNSFVKKLLDNDDDDDDDDDDEKLPESKISPRSMTRRRK